MAVVLVAAVTAKVSSSCRSRRRQCRKAVAAVVTHAICCSLPPAAGAVELRNSLSQRFGLVLHGTLVFDYPTPSALASYCHKQLLAASSAASDAADAASGGASSELARREAEGALSNSAGGSWMQQLNQQQQRQQPGLVVTIDATAARLAAPDANSCSTDSCQAVPYGRWDVDGTAANVSHRPGGRFGRQVRLCEGWLQCGVLGAALARCGAAWRCCRVAV